MKNIWVILLGYHILAIGTLAYAGSQTLPNKMRDFFLQEKQSTKSEHFLDTDLSVQKINSRLYKIQYEGLEADVADFYQLTFCVADYLAFVNNFKYWDMGRPIDVEPFDGKYRYVRYVIMRESSKDDWLAMSEREKIEWEDSEDFERIERQVTLAHYFCPNQVRQIYLFRKSESKVQ